MGGAYHVAVVLCPFLLLEESEEEKGEVRGRVVGEGGKVLGEGERVAIVTKYAPHNRHNVLDLLWIVCEVKGHRVKG